MSVKIYTIGRAEESDFQITKPGAYAFASKHSGWGSTYVARLKPVAGNLLKFEREFLPVHIDQTSRAGNGDVAFALTDDGVYEGSGVERSYESTKEVFELRGGEFYSLDTEDKVLLAVHQITTEQLADARRVAKEALEQKNLENAQKNAERGLVALTGSDKQIAWAETIRNKVLEGFDRRVARLSGELDQDSAMFDKTIIQLELTQAQSTLTWLIKQNKAGFWIDQRSRNLDQWEEYWSVLVAPKETK